MSAVAQRVEQALSPVVAEKGFDLEAVEVQPAGRRRLVRVLVDQDGGVTLDDIAALTSLLSQTLDASDAMGEQPYVLEVSSPGVGRPLTLPRHWRRNRDRRVSLTTTDGSTFAGRIAAADDAGVTVIELAAGDTAGAKGSGAAARGAKGEGDAERTFPYTDIADAHVEVEF